MQVETAVPLCFIVSLRLSAGSWAGEGSLLGRTQSLFMALGNGSLWESKDKHSGSVFSFCIEVKAMWFIVAICSEVTCYTG